MPTQSDTCILVDSQSSCFIAVYVDDLLIIAANQQTIDQIISHLEKEFKIKDLGHVNYLLGMKIKQERGVITITQQSFILKMLEEVNLLDSNPKKTPMDASINYHN